jgi:hypothetical protein
VEKAVAVGSRVAVSDGKSETVGVKVRGSVGIVVAVRKGTVGLADPTDGSVDGICDAVAASLLVGVGSTSMIDEQIQQIAKSETSKVTTLAAQPDFQNFENCFIVIHPLFHAP